MITQATPLTPEVSSALKFQSYESQTTIDGAYYLKLAKHRSLEGSFMEYLRLTGGTIEGLPAPFEVRQLSFSWAVAGRVNAFHIHPKVTQDELWCVVGGTLMVWLVDCRVDSPTRGVRRQYLLNAEEPALLHIPSGVAHGYRAGPEGALLVYAMNSQFNARDPNEGRLPWDHFGAELWEDDRG